MEVAMCIATASTIVSMPITSLGGVVAGLGLAGYSSFRGLGDTKTPLLWALAVRGESLTLLTPRAAATAFLVANLSLAVRRYDRLNETLQKDLELQKESWDKDTTEHIETREKLTENVAALEKSVADLQALQHRRR